MRKAILALTGALLFFAGAARAVRSECAPGLAYEFVIPAQDGGPDWASSPKGSLSGTLRFSAKRPPQPIVVYLVREGGDGSFPVPQAAEFGQKGAKFNPSFAMLVRGQEATFVNDEDKDIDHNIYFLGAAELDLGIFAKGQKVSHKFEQAGEVSVHCSIHKLMDGKLFVAPSPAFAVLEGSAASFTIKDIPTGRYTLKTWQRSKRFKDASLEVVIEAGKTTQADAEMTR